MESVGNDRRDFARAIYERHIQQWRAVETRRTAFFLLYLFIVSLIVIWRGTELFSLRLWPALLFLFAIAKVGYLSALHDYIEINSHRQAADYILDRYGLHHYWQQQQIPVILKLMPADKLYLVFYLFAFSFWLMALLIAIWHNVLMAVIIAAVVYGLGFIGTMLYRPGQMTRER